MTIAPEALLVIVALSTMVGFYAVYLYGKETRAFKWHEYLFFVLVAFIPLIPMGMVYDSRIYVLFVVSIVLGLLLEHVIGYLYHRTLNRRLWRYYKYTIGGYTSLLVAPFWGMAGIFFFLLGEVVMR